MCHILKPDIHKGINMLLQPMNIIEMIIMIF